MHSILWYFPKNPRRYNRCCIRSRKICIRGECRKRTKTYTLLKAKIEELKVLFTNKPLR